jgi:ribosomal peptide maturation radical SAM protein 1
MTKIALITMPAQELERPSLSLTQLKARVREVHGDRAEVSIAYLNHDFARFMAGAGGATGAYATLCANQHTGLPDWLFRSEAWPELPDNADRYFARYYPGRAPAALELRTAMLGCRARLGEFLDAAIETHALDRADVVGFTSMFAQNVASFALARRLKQRNPGVTIVMGGANCESPMGQELVRNVPAVDYVFSGPALLSFPEFVGHLLEGRRERCATIPGVVGRDTPAEAAAHPIGAELPIDEPVALDYADYFASVARNFPAGEVRPVILFETSRGCWWGERSHCTFCGLNGATMSYRSMRPDGAVALINSLFERYRDRSAVFFSVDNILPQAYVSEVLPRLRTPQGATIFYEVKANLGERELSALAAAGVRQIQPGIEALSTSTLKLMRKGSTAFVNLRLLLGCVRHGIEPVWNLLVGFPGEGEEVYRMYVEQLGRLVHLWPPQGVAQVRYDRYSPYHQRPQEWGLKLRRFDFYPLIYPFSEESLEPDGLLLHGRELRGPVPAGALALDGEAVAGGAALALALAGPRRGAAARARAAARGRRRARDRHAQRAARRARRERPQGASARGARPAAPAVRPREPARRRVRERAGRAGRVGPDLARGRAGAEPGRGRPRERGRGRRAWLRRPRSPGASSH